MSYAKDMLMLPANLATLAKLAGKPTGRFGATTGVRLRATENGYRAEATNGRYLAIVSGPAACDENDYPEIPALRGAPNGESEATVPAAAWKKAFAAAPKRTGKPCLKSVAARLGKDVTTLATTDLDTATVLQPRNVEGRWPATEKVLPEGEPLVRVRVDAKLLTELLAVASAYAEEGGAAVSLEVYHPDKPFAVRAANGSGQEFTGVLVPLTPAKK